MHTEKKKREREPPGGPRELQGRPRAPSVFDLCNSPCRRGQWTLHNKDIKERCSQESRSSYRRQFYLERISLGPPTREQPLNGVREGRFLALCPLLSFSSHLGFLSLLPQFNHSDSDPLFSQNLHLYKETKAWETSEQNEMELSSRQDRKSRKFYQRRVTITEPNAGQVSCQC